MAAAFVLSSTDTSAEIALGALNSGTSGNSITFQITLGGTAPGLTAIPTSPLFLFDGGVTTLAPLKYDARRSRASRPSFASPMHPETRRQRSSRDASRGTITSGFGAIRVSRIPCTPLTSTSPKASSL